MSNLELRIEEEASLNLTFGESSDMSFSAVDFVGVPFAPTVEVENIEGGHRVSITSMGAEGKKTDEFDVMDGADGATGPQGPKGDSYEITAADYAEIAEVVEEDIQDVIENAQDATDDATAAAAEARAASAATWLSGNVLFGELTEAAVLTADDAYAAPPKGVEVFGKSTQVQTTGKNLFDPTTVTLGKYFDVNGYLANTSNWDVSDYIEVSGTSICVSGNNTANNVYHAFYDESKTLLSTVRIDTAQPFTIPSDAKYIRVTIHKTRTNTAQVELGTAATSYEPYSGGAASPRPDWPQEIKSVDELALHANDTRGVTRWNQLVPTTTASTTSQGVTVTGNGDGSVTISGTCTNAINISMVKNIGIIANHRYLIRGGLAGGSPQTYYLNLSGMGYDYGSGDIFSYPSNFASGTIRYTLAAGVTFDNAIVWPHLFDLTVMFGAGNEPSTVAEFESMFPEPYYPYDPGSWLDSGDWPVQIPLSNHIARSLPDGTRDTLTLSYVAPSTEHEGWGVFSKTLVQRCDVVDLGTLTWNKAEVFYASLSQMDINGTQPVICAAYAVDNTVSDYSSAMRIADKTAAGGHGAAVSYVYIKDSTYTDVMTLKASLSGVILQYKLATPITHDLGTVELPVMPNPLTAWADGGSAQPTLALEYEQDINIVIARLKDAIADMATS